MRIAENVKLQFRAEFFERLEPCVLQQPEYDRHRLSAFGTINGEKAYPRRIQLGPKIIY